MFIVYILVEIIKGKYGWNSYEEMVWIRLFTECGSKEAYYLKAGSDFEGYREKDFYVKAKIVRGSEITVNTIGGYVSP